MFYSIKNKDNFRQLVFAGFLIGLLPALHAHSFIAVSLVSLLLGLIFRKNLKYFAYLFIPAIILAVPQVLAIQTQVGESFFGFSAGWLDVANTNSSNIFVDASAFVSFWIMNLGAFLILLLVGFLKGNKTIRRFYVPFVILFFLANFVRFQPWDWDNYKLFVHWYLLTIVLASIGLATFTDILSTNWKLSFRTHKQKLLTTKKVKTLIGTVAVVGLLVLCVGSGFLTHTRSIQRNYLVWSESDKIFAEWITQNTDSPSVFLTSTSFAHPAVTLAGRQIILGYTGWLWSHGIDLTKIRQVRSDLIDMFKGNYTLMTEYGVDYISVTDYERNFADDHSFKINIEYFMNSDLFEKVYDETLNGKQWMIFSVM
jgi:hypothetical protein